MRLPTGYGSIIKMGGKRRRPFAARIMDGQTMGNSSISTSVILQHAKKRCPAWTTTTNGPTTSRPGKSPLPASTRNGSNGNIPGSIKTSRTATGPPTNTVSVSTTASSSTCGPMTSSVSLTVVRRATARKRISACFAVSSTSTPPAWRSP